MRDRRGRQEFQQEDMKGMKDRKEADGGMTKFPN
jgi:hypothetical protein